MKSDCNRILTCSPRVESDCNPIPITYHEAAVIKPGDITENSEL